MRPFAIDGARDSIAVPKLAVVLRELFPWSEEYCCGERHRNDTDTIERASRFARKYPCVFRVRETRKK